MLVSGTVNAAIVNNGDELLDVDCIHGSNITGLCLSHSKLGHFSQSIKCTIQEASLKRKLLNHLSTDSQATGLNEN
ncbi:hypothetical protein ANTQUA_LOCUS5032 [Anthophora quadrimaculata]